MRNKIRVMSKFIVFVIFAVSFVSCGKSSEIEESEGAVSDETTTANPQGPSDIDLPDEVNEESPVDNISEHFEDTECNRHYWIFKCALEFKASQKHSEECQSHIKSFYPNDENRMSRISAQSKNQENVIKATWTNYFNKHCKDVVSVKESLKNLN